MTLPDEQSPIVFVDTEATTLRRSRRVWDIAAIRREPDGAERAVNLIVLDVDLSDADYASLQIGHFYQRHPRFGGDLRKAEAGYRREFVSESKAAALVDDITRGAHIIGAVPDFDVWALTSLLGRHQLAWGGHYHLVDVENLMVGWLAGHSKAAPGVSRRPPYDSEALSLAIGVEPPPPERRHTALGDALWVRDIWDVIIEGRKREFTALPPQA